MAESRRSRLLSCALAASGLGALLATAGGSGVAFLGLEAPSLLRRGAAPASAGGAASGPWPQAPTGAASAAVTLAALAALGATLASRPARGAGPRSTSVARRATRTEWYRKVQRISGDRALFDVTIPKPMGVKLEFFPPGGKLKGIGVSQVVKGGNTDIINRRVCVDDEPGMWVLEGDQLVAVDGKDCKDSDIQGVVELVTGNGKNEVTLTLVRETRRGPVKVVVMPDGNMETVRRGCRLSAAAEYAKGGELKYGCIDGWCGTCWHRERTTNGIFKPCCDVITEDWDNVVPLVITPKPEKVGDSTFLNPRGVA